MGERRRVKSQVKFFHFKKHVTGLLDALGLRKNPQCRQLGWVSWTYVQCLRLGRLSVFPVDGSNMACSPSKRSSSDSSSSSSSESACSHFSGVCYVRGTHLNHHHCPLLLLRCETLNDFIIIIMVLIIRFYSRNMHILGDLVSFEFWVKSLCCRSLWLWRSLLVPYLRRQGTASHARAFPIWSVNTFCEQSHLIFIQTNAQRGRDLNVFTLSIKLFV